MMDVNDNYKPTNEEHVTCEKPTASDDAAEVPAVEVESEVEKIVIETEAPSETLPLAVEKDSEADDDDLMVEVPDISEAVDSEQKDCLLDVGHLKATIFHLVESVDVAMPEPAPDAPSTDFDKQALTPRVIESMMSDDDDELIETDFDMLGTVLSPARNETEEKIEDDVEKVLKTPEPVNDVAMEEEDLLVEVLSPQPKSTSSSDGENVKKTSFVDSLLNKIRRENSDSSETEITNFQKILSESDEDLLVEVEAPVRYSKSSNPNLLPTPIVRNPRVSSAFVNTDEEYRTSVAKHKFRKTYSQDDKSQMGSKSEPPKMQAPEMPANVQRPRTLAEKRQLVNKSNANFLMVEQESKIYRQVQRKKTQMEINYSLLDSMLFEDIPINPGPWKVLTWLRTREGNYIHQFVNLSGSHYRLNGSRGNHARKLLSPQPSEPLQKHQNTFMRSTRCCKGGRIKKRIFDSLLTMPSIRRFVLEENVDPYKRLETKYLDNQLVSIKPRPLSKKIEFINLNRKLLSGDEDSAFLGDYSKFEMPNIILEFNVQPKATLAPTVKKYLKEILPHRDLNENWCNFALSALDTKADDEAKIDNFEFTIPYQDSKKSILVREIVRAKQDTEQLRIHVEDDVDDDDEDAMEWTFAKDADKDDPDECEIVDIIKDLTNSVFINLNDDLFTRDDPFDRKNSSTSSPVKSKEAIQELSSLVKPDKCKKVLMELKRLNANVFISESPCVEDENDMRRHATAHLGKIERELRPTVVVTESDTVLLGNQEKESRRIKRAPKKFDDYEKSGSRATLSDTERDEPSTKKAKVDANDEDKAFKGRLRGTDQNCSVEEMKSIKQEVRKMIHVSVGVRRLRQLDSIEAFCLVHNLYKCHCKGAMLAEGVYVLKPVEVIKPTEKPPPLKPQPICSTAIKAREVHVKTPFTSTLHQSTEASAPEDENEYLIDDGYSRRVLPVSIDAKKVKRPSATAVFNSSEGLPKIEIVNLSDLINSGIGPIYINVYDDKTMRLNPILRSVLNNKSAIVYFDGIGYFVDKTRVNVNKLDFSSLETRLEHPVFIIQSKDDFAPPVSSTMTDDFVKILYRNDSNQVLKIIDRSALHEIGGIIDSILRNVRRKLEAKFEGEPTELVREQLSMLTKEGSRSRSNSASVSSTGSSPLSFQGLKLLEAPPPGTDTAIMQEFNQIFSSRMQRLVALVGSNTLGLRASNEMFNKFYIYRWSLLLKSFEEDLIQVWQVRLESESGEKYQMMALTDTRDVPEIEHAKKDDVVNIRFLSLSDNITELTRLLLLRVENAKMKNMTILFYGCRGYLRICGILNSKEPYVNGFVAKPTRATHPRIAAKIQKIYHVWHTSRMSRVKQEILRNENESAHRREQQNEYAPLVSRSESIQNKAPLGAQRKSGQSEYKWFLFNITNDFSDIYVKNWCRYISYKVVMEAINRAKSQNRAVALVPTMKNIQKWPKIFALPAAPLKFKEHDSMTDNFLIFGPYTRNSNSNLLLMQNVDGKLMLRDEYERRNSVTRSKRTRCLWIYANTLKVLNDADPHPLKLMWGREGEKEKESNATETKQSPNLKISTVIGGFDEDSGIVNDQDLGSTV